VGHFFSQFTLELGYVWLGWGLSLMHSFHLLGSLCTTTWTSTLGKASVKCRPTSSILAAIFFSNDFTNFTVLYEKNKKKKQKINEERKRKIMLSGKKAKNAIF